MGNFDYKTALNQLTQATNGMNRLRATTGANSFVLDNENQGIAFRFKMSKKFNWCKISLDATDTYTVEFIKIWGSKTTREAKFEGIYNDMLKDLFEKETGLYLKLF